MLPSRADLHPWVRQFVQDAQHADGVHVREESARDYRVLGGGMQRVRRLAHAFLHLESGGFATEGRLLVRSALEHAVTAQWAYLTVSGIDRLEVGMMHARVEYAMQSSQVGDSDWDQLVDRLRSQFPKAPTGARMPGMPKFSGREGVLKLMDHTGYFQRAYSVLSRAGHFTDQTITDYFLADRNSVGVSTAPPPDHDSDAIFHTLATSCCLIAWIAARLEGNEKEMESATSQGLLWRLDTHLPAKRRRFPGETR